MHLLMDVYVWAVHSFDSRPHEGLEFRMRGLGYSVKGNKKEAHSVKGNKKEAPRSRARNRTRTRYIAPKP